MYKTVLKRTIDFISALLALIILLPFLIVITFILSFANWGSPFFVQARPGLNGHIFNVIKFKTMNSHLDNQGHLLPDNERIHNIGNFIRATSLDELPQLINVLKGDMSFIGPRPLLPEYLPLYNTQQIRRHNVRPGITGWAQVNGRNAISWQQKFEHDIWYVENISLKLDLKIVVLTIKKVLKREDINSGENITMTKFNGNI